MFRTLFVFYLIFMEEKEESEESAASSFRIEERPEDGGRMFLRNIDICLQKYTESHSKGE